ncbi:nuclear transport factor 2 family protein [Clostridia bacterium]|nr:nuclear transport factor 2 family protein [Clostridia bacterium]
MHSKPEINKKNAIDFYTMAFKGNPKEAVKRYVGDEYIQHNPDVADGPDAFIDYFTRMALEYPIKDIEFVRVVAENDLVAVHTHQFWPDNEEYITMDFFRFDENSKIVEHWDAIQKIPAETKSGNTMF